jgi:NAD(P)-dependent dehydrogenase (short-subunit alcohol dehydrogenase family)
VLATNLTSAFHTCRAALPGMVERGFGRILNISGADAFIGSTHRAHGVTSKAALLGLTRALASEFGPHGVTVNAVVPGLLDTSRDPRHYDANVLNAWRGGLPIARTGTPAEVAALCVFLAGEQAAYITGQSLHVNGGGVMP